MELRMNMNNQLDHKHILSDLYSTALGSVNGCNAVERQLNQTPIRGEVAILAVGKAASSMMLGAKNALSSQIFSALVITKSEYADRTLNYPFIESGHPIPNQESLNAGHQLLEFINNIPENVSFLALVSGGASALVEVLPDGMELEDLQNLNKWLLSSGLDIHEINNIRQGLSLIKGGKALNYLKQKHMTQFLLSDVRDDEPSIIGSGLFVKNDNTLSSTKMPDEYKKYIQPSQDCNSVLADSYIVASNEMACQAIIEQAKQLEYDVIYHGQTLYGDVLELSERLAKELISAEAGIHIWGGEPTIVLPDKTGRGGRNQSLALDLACELESIKNITVLVAATDGSDGPTDDAGAIIDGFTLQRASGNANEYLASADAGSFLAKAGDLLSTGPTGTNVMDIVIAIKEVN